MRIGIFAKTFVRPTLEAVFDAVHDAGLTCIQFNMSCAGLEPLPERIPGELCDRIHRETSIRKITMSAVSGTFNMCHPDPEVRQNGLKRLRVLAESCERLGTSVITLCTGSRDPQNMWRRHPLNDTPEAWADMVESVKAAVKIAHEYSLRLGIEPEVNNVVDSADKARRLLNEVGSPRLKIIMDGANLFHEGELPRMKEILDQAFELLGKDIIIAHAKDIARDGEAGHEAAGTGLLDYDHYLGLMRKVGFEGPLILHSLDESQVDGCISFLRNRLERAFRK